MEENLAKQVKRQQEKESKKFVKAGKASMPRSEKPQVKRQEKKAVELTEEQKDKLKYLELID